MTEERGAARRAAEAGFTLIEVLTALSVVALLIAAMPVALQFGKRAWQTSDRVEQSTTAAAGAAFVEGRIARAMPLLRRDRDGIQRMVFSGTPQALTFVAPVVDGPMGTGVFQFEISVRSIDGARNALVMSWQPYRPQQSGNIVPARDERVIVDEIADFRLRYFGRQDMNGQRAWTDQWASSTAMPELVEVTMRPRSGLDLGGQPIVVEMLGREVP